jgi:hypothetical protein
MLRGGEFHHVFDPFGLASMQALCRWGPRGKHGLAFAPEDQLRMN